MMIHTSVTQWVKLGRVIVSTKFSREIFMKSYLELFAKSTIELKKEIT
jgi:hypothetical protein